MDQELARLFYREIQKISAHPQLDESGQTRALYDLLAKIFSTATKAENFFFSTLFARISYAGHRFSMSEEVLRLVHTFRRAVEQSWKTGKSKTPISVQKNLGIRAVAESVLVLSGSAFPSELIDILAKTPDFSFQKPETWDFKEKIRVIALEDDPENEALICRDEAAENHKIRVLYNLPDRNDSFQPTIETIRSQIGFPVTLNLLEVDIDRAGNYRPRAFVIEPDLLMDVSAVSETFSLTGAEPLHFLVKKFLPYEKTPAILLGNIANFFLDELMHNPESAFPVLIRQAFLLDPLVFSQLDDQTVKDLNGKAQKHFVNLKNMVTTGFAVQGITAEDCLLEPSFFSETHGLQGRLDVFCKNPAQPAIVELKSGKAFAPNSYGIGVSHFIQTLLYDLLVKSVFRKKLTPANFILYSSADIEPLKFAPVVQAQQLEAVQVRNQLVGIERSLAAIMPGSLAAPIFQKIKGKTGTGFVARDFELFAKTLENLDDTERKYFNSFAGFIAREQFLAKIGTPDSERLNGHAALWLHGIDAKNDAFEILSHLQLVDNQAFEQEPFLIFQKTERTNRLANFRTGDIAVLWPWREAGDSVLDSQVIKCTITSLEGGSVRVSLRGKQSNPAAFGEAVFWNLEHDMMDNGFTASYKSLVEWAVSPKKTRDLLLARRPPEMNLAATDLGEILSPVQVGETIEFDLSKAPKIEGVTSSHPLNSPRLTSEQSRIFTKIIESRDYFLLWGPPGTGKTSVMLREIVAHFFEKTDENLLLLAYTNRAVDEICEAIESVGEAAATGYVRIGSKHSTGKNYREKLLKSKISAATKRREIIEILAAHRIFVGTVASFTGQAELLNLKKFNRLIIDEASQILEPGLLGLLTRFEHFTLIGDHKQLPAVSSQNARTAIVDDPDLQKIGLTDLRDSLFERLFRQSQAENWHWAFDKLSHQGRMHADIMDFPNRHFYGGMLKTLPGNRAQTSDEPFISAPPTPPGGGEPQSHASSSTTSPNDFPVAEKDSSISRVWPSPLLGGLGGALLEKRVVFIPTPPDEASLTGKTNQFEAKLAVEIAHFFKEKMEETGRAWHHGSLGIITPWRAQIAQIASVFDENEPKTGLKSSDLTIDTVERYQGGARDIIILSLSVNQVSQLESLVSVNAEGVDRKLNVALTRAREHVVVLGCAGVLRRDGRYLDFMERYGIELAQLFE